jgi:hypothetical protein
MNRCRDCSKFISYVALLACSLLLSLPSHAQAPDPHSVPSVDGGAGPCSVELTVNNESGAPVYAAKVRVHFSYGFVGAHKMDLEVATNVDGKARFNGLPKKAKISLLFLASQGGKEADFNYDPSASCTAKQTLMLKKPLD